MRCGIKWPWHWKRLVRTVFSNARKQDGKYAVFITALAPSAPAAAHPLRPSSADSQTSSSDGRGRKVFSQTPAIHDTGKVDGNRREQVRGCCQMGARVRLLQTARQRRRCILGGMIAAHPPLLPPGSAPPEAADASRRCSVGGWL